MKTVIKQLNAEILDMKTARLTMDVDKSALENMPSADKPLSVEIKVYRKKRSLSANAYLWVLLDKMARLMGGGHSKEFLYLRYIREVGRFDASVWVFKDAYDAYKKQWESMALGNICDILKIEGNMYNLICYFGTHYYDSKEMTFFIDKIIADAEELGIPTLTPKEYAEMMKGLNNEKR